MVFVRTAMQAAERLVSFYSERQEQRARLAATQAEIDVWHCKLQHAECYEEWLEAARNLDELEGCNDWKREPASEHYDSKRIQQQLAEITRLQAQGDYVAMTYWLRSELQRNLGGIGNPKLYAHSHVGTKVLIENYNEELLRMLYHVCHCKEEDLSLEKKLHFFTESRHALGKTALLLSGGASLGMYHFGVIKALYLQGLLPRVISGSSAGAIVVAILGVKTGEELHALFTGGTEVIKRDINLDFFSNKGSLLRKIERLLSKGVLMDIVKLQDALKKNIGDITFSEAYTRTGRIINVTVSPGNDFERARLLNYLTAPNVLIWSAASASCALPGLYESVQLLAKNLRGEVVPYHLSNVTWTDGSLQQDLPINRLKELFNVNYIIVSQTNPHAIPFIQTFQRPSRRISPNVASPSLIRRLAGAAGYLICSEVMLRCQQLVDLGLAPSVLSLLLNQKYVGDVTIVPPITLEGYCHIISNPSLESFERFVKVAERRTWPNAEHIRSQCQAEMVLDECVRLLAHRAQESMSLLKGPSPGEPNKLVLALRHRQVARTSQQDEAALAATASQSPSPLGRPRHTHIDLCQFFSAHQSTHQSNFAPTSSTSSNEGGQHQAGDDDGECQDGGGAGGAVQRQSPEGPVQSPRSPSRCQSLQGAMPRKDLFSRTRHAAGVARGGRELCGAGEGVADALVGGAVNSMRGARGGQGLSMSAPCLEELDFGEWATEEQGEEECDISGADAPEVARGVGRDSSHGDPLAAEAQGIVKSKSFPFTGMMAAGPAHELLGLVEHLS